MATNISWTDETWNPTTGCSHVSEGCRNCYAETLSLRHGWTEKPWSARNAAVNVRLRSDRLHDPLHWRRPRMVFVNSMSDLFHELVPFTFIAEVFTVMAQTPRHTFQILTKRPARMLEFLKWNYPMYPREFVEQDWLGSWPNVWLGVSCEDQRTADERIPLLLQMPAAVRFISAEPLLGPISLLESIRVLHRQVGDFSPPFDRKGGIDWVIAGGESGPDYRTMDISWARELRDQCHQYGVPFFMKQDSGARPGKQGRIPNELWVQEFPASRETAPA